MSFFHSSVGHLKSFLDESDTKKKKIDSKTASSDSKSVKADSKQPKAESRKSGSSINSRNNHVIRATEHKSAARSSGAGNSRKSQDVTSADAVAESEAFDIDREIDVELKSMQQIESARAQWRKIEEDRLEESWNALSRFDRNQKTRLSLDLENDILDEYLNNERSKPRVPTTITEEPEQGGAPLDDNNSEEEDFFIPELPKGRLLVINIRSTWGDRHYVGLNGIEVFSDSGSMPEIDSIRAEPKDINVLPEYDKDPRVVDNLLDGINRTRDDTHMWLAPFTNGRDHKVFITFKRPTRIAMMRVWVRKCNHEFSCAI